MKKSFVAAFFLFFISLSSFTQTTDSKQQFPINSAVRHGVLSNGLKYFILKNDTPANVIEMSLTVDVGDQDESNGFTSLAHIIEHIGMRSTIHFPDGIRNYLIDKGINRSASTAGKTHYNLTILARDTKLFETGLLALQDWCGGLLFKPGEVQEELSAVYRELEMANKPAYYRLEYEPYRQLESNERYKPSVLLRMDETKRATLKDLVDFYKCYYRPVNQTITIVGDVDEIEVESQIKKYFEPLTNVGACEKLKDNQQFYEVPLSGKSQFIVSDGDKNISLRLFKKRKSSVNINTSTINDVRTLLLYELGTDIVRRRLKAVSMDKDLPNTLGFEINDRAINIKAGIDALIFNANLLKSEEIKPIIQFVAAEVRRLQLYGFTQTEFEMARVRILKPLLYREVTSSSTLAAVLAGGEPLPEDVRTTKLSLLENISLSEINLMLSSWLVESGDIDLIISTSYENQKSLPTEAEIFLWINQILQSNVARYVENRTSVKDLSKILPKETLDKYRIKELSGLGATKVILKNGVTLILKKVDSQDIWIRGINPVFKSSYNSLLDGALSDVSQFMALHSLSKADILAWAKQREEEGTMYANLSIKKIETNVFAVASRANIEPAMQILHSYLTQSVPDEKAFKKYIIDKANENSYERSPLELFEDSIWSLVSGESRSRHSRLIIKDTSEMLKNINETYKIAFSKLNNFTFVITGPFDRAEMIHLATLYLGCVPTANKQKKARESLARSIQPKDFPKPKNFTMIGDSVGNVDVRILFSGRCDPTLKNKLTLEVLSSSLNGILFHRLREKEKAVYSVIASQFFKGTNEDFVFRIEFETAPENVDRLVKAVKDEFHKLSTDYLDNNVLERAKMAVQHKINTQMKSQKYWDEYLGRQVRNGKIFSDEVKKREILSRISVNDIQYAVRHFIAIEDLSVFKLL